MILLFSKVVDEPKDTCGQTSLYFETQELQSKELREDVRVIGDSSYAGEPKFIIVSQNGQSKKLHEFLSRSKNHEEALQCSGSRAGISL